MICPTCNIPMHHLNNGGGFAGTDTYQTWDTLKCPECEKKVVEIYHTEFLEDYIDHVSVEVKVTKSLF